VYSCKGSDRCEVQGVPEFVKEKKGGGAEWGPKKEGLGPLTSWDFGVQAHALLGKSLEKALRRDLSKKRTEPIQTVPP